MSTVVLRRWTADGVTWFAVGGLGSELAGPAQRLLMGYERYGGEWRRAYPAGTPRLDRCWENFRACAPAMLRQAARLDPVRWREALRELCDRTGGLGWWLTGSAALAVRGVPLEPGDLDLVCTPGEAIRLGEVFADALVEPVAEAGAGWISDLWGRAFWAARIEWIGGPKPAADQPLPSDFGPAAAASLQTIRWEDWAIRVPPLRLQRAVSRRRGLLDRVALIDALDRRQRC
jgi:hypothetical protein